jgi:hypothetical protein
MRLTAGKGLWHGEQGGTEKSAVMEGLQFWVNLKKSQKGVQPSFQYEQDAGLPRQEQDQGRVLVKVLVGPGSPIQIMTPMVYLEVRVRPGGTFALELPSSHQGFVYVLEGQARFPEDGALAAEGQVAVLGSGSGITVENPADTDLLFLLAAGEPHREPVLWNGPFVD